ncbi:MAG: pyridoxamine 5'-phosphate oxidase [Bacteroidota bacterium]
MKKELEKLKKDYQNRSIYKKNLPDDPIALMKLWMNEALENDLFEPNAMAIATVNDNRRTSLRIVLLKDFNSEGLVFYTNYNSRKAKDLEDNPFISALFFWPVFERQIRVEGFVEKTKTEESDTYFSGRPRASQIGAWASPQSEKIDSRDELDQKYLEIEQKYQGKPIPRPPYWGGYRIKPAYFEFWQGRPGRMNDRIIFMKEGKRWRKERLAP